MLGVDPARPTRAWRDRIGLVLLQECELEPLYGVRETVALHAGIAGLAVAIRGFRWEPQSGRG